MACHIYCIIYMTEMNNCTHKDNVAIQTPLVLDIDSEPFKGTDKWIYNYRVGMLHYLSCKEWPGIKLNQITHHTCNYKLSLNISIKRIYWYINKTRYKGLISKPTNFLNMDFYVDVNFAGLWHVENPVIHYCQVTYLIHHKLIGMPDIMVQ